MKSNAPVILTTNMGYRGGWVVSDQEFNARQMSSRGDLEMGNAEKQPRRVVEPVAPSHAEDS